MKILLILALLVSAAFADCTASGNGCSEPAFLTSGLSLMFSCTAESTTLLAALNVSTTPTQFDSAWSTFCGGSCHTSMTQISTAHYCCIDDYGLGPMFRNLLQFCQMSKQSPTRRCGAELGNIGAVACQASTPNDCAALGTCEWAEGMCLYKPTKQSLDLICTDCNRAYFENFPTGGVNPIASYSKLAAVYDFACNKIEGQYCLLTAAEHGYRSAGQLSASDISSYCGNPADTVAKRCFRSLTATSAKALTYTARYSDLFCDVNCQQTFVGVATLAKALESSAATMCANDGANNCFAKGAAAMSDSCFAGAVGTGSCSGACDLNATAIASNLGCCGPTFSTSGAAIAQGRAAGRLLLLAIAGASNNVNQTGTYPRSPLPAATLQTYTNAAIGQSRTETFVGLQACSNFSSAYNSWVASASQCTVRPFTRTYVFVLQLSYAAFTSCANNYMVKSSLIADIIPKLGITSAQIVGDISFSSHASGMSMTIKISAESAAEIQQIDATVYAGISFPLLTAGREFLYMCPTVLLKGVYTPIVQSVTPSGSIVGDVVILTTTTTTQTTLAATIAPTPPNGLASVSYTFAAIVIAFCTLLTL